MTVLHSSVVLVVSRESPADRGKILTVTNLAHGGIGMPGGKVEPEETIWQAACRELHEEANLVVDMDDLQVVFEAPWRFRRLDGQMGPERTVHLFYARRVRGTPQALEAGTEMAWVTFDELLNVSPFASYYYKALPGGALNLRETEIVA